MKRLTMLLAILVLTSSLATSPRATPPPKEETLDLGGGVKLTLVWIPGGSFKMGSGPSAEEIAKRYGGKAEFDADEHPAHEVKLGGFWMGKHEVTNAQFRRFRPGHVSGYFDGETLNQDEQPAVNLNWNDAVAFCQWLTARSGKKIALPTEAQWEYVCRAGTKTERYWGDDDAPMGRYANVMDETFKSRFAAAVPEIAKFYGIPEGQVTAPTTDGHAAAAPVGSYVPNAFGLYDMIGNVREWCQDYYHPGYSGAPGDGSAWLSPVTAKRVLRGGSWGDLSACCRSASHCSGDPGLGNDVWGFRVCAAER